jgi:putative nucleotidyltransferase with HDIG domain
MHNLQSLLEQSEELPSLPEIYLRITELLESDVASAHDIGAAVQTDLSLTARILKLINSAYYGLPHQVTSVPQAVTLLGRQQLQQILMTSVLSGVFNGIDIDRFPLRDFWRHSTKTGIIARHLAMQNASILDHEAFFTAGLLHDIGWLVIAKLEPAAYAEVNEAATAEGRDPVLVEDEQLGMTHVDVGVMLMKKWNMPSLITQCIKKHHGIVHDGPLGIETAIVYLANRLSHYPLKVDEEEMQLRLSNIPRWEQAKCPLYQITVACETAEEQWREVMESLGMEDLEITDEEDEEQAEFNTAIGRFF